MSKCAPAATLGRRNQRPGKARLPALRAVRERSSRRSGVADLERPDSRRRRMSSNGLRPPARPGDVARTVLSASWKRYARRSSSLPSSSANWRFATMNWPPCDSSTPAATERAAVLDELHQPAGRLVGRSQRCSPRLSKRMRPDRFAQVEGLVADLLSVSVEMARLVEVSPWGLPRTHVVRPAQWRSDGILAGECNAFCRPSGFRLAGSSRPAPLAPLGEGREVRVCRSRLRAEESPLPNPLPEGEGGSHRSAGRRRPLRWLCKGRAAPRRASRPIAGPDVDCGNARSRLSSADASATAVR